MTSHARATAVAEAPGSAPSTSAAYSTRTGEAPWILLVDDDELALRRLCQVLELNGLGCVAVLNAIDALIYCDRHRPHVIVTDLTMPELDGGVLARWLKARYPSVPIIVVTGQDVTDPAIKALLETAAEVLPKPVDLDHLVDLLSSLAGAPDGQEGTLGLP